MFCKKFHPYSHVAVALKVQTQHITDNDMPLSMNGKIYLGTVGCCRRLTRRRGTGIVVSRKMSAPKSRCVAGGNDSPNEVHETFRAPNLGIRRGHTSFLFVDHFSSPPSAPKCSRFKPAPSPWPLTNVQVKTMSSNQKKRPPPEGVIDLTLDSGDEDCRKPAAFVTPKFPKVKHEGSLSARVTPKFEDDGLILCD